MLEAYAEGVNAGLNALGAAPPEYLVLRGCPNPGCQRIRSSPCSPCSTPCRAGKGYSTNHRSDARCPAGTDVPILATVGSEWDAPVVGAGTVRPAIPGPDVFDLRQTRRRKLGSSEAPILEWLPRDAGRLWKTCSGLPWLPCFSDGFSTIGSNNWAVDGAHTASGEALVANDMHLSIGVPIIWYRASLAFRTADGAPQRITGVTLPACPAWSWQQRARRVGLHEQRR